MRSVLCIDYGVRNRERMSARKSDFCFVISCFRCRLVLRLLAVALSGWRVVFEVLAGGVAPWNPQSDREKDMSQNRSRRETTLKVRMDEAEYADLKIRAEAAGSDLSKFVRQVIQNSRVVSREDWRKCVYVLTEVNVSLALLVQRLERAEDSFDAVNLIFVLSQIDRTIRQALSAGSTVR